MCGDYALQVAFDSGLKQLQPVLGHVVGTQHAAGLRRDQRPENALAFEQGLVPYVAPVKVLNVEGIEPRLGPVPEQIPFGGNASDFHRVAQECPCFGHLSIPLC